jgi:phospholipid/cholesterol/gamma-HCH transport system permease protein
MAVTAPAPRSAALSPDGQARGGYRSQTTRRALSDQGLLDALISLGQITGLGWRTVRAAVTPPYTWGRDFVDECWFILSRCLLPLALASAFLGFGAPGLQAGNLLNLLGASDRLGAFFVLISVREIASLLTGLVVAGVAGTAICADLGARRVREEIEAMTALAVDPVKKLVVPRFAALGAMAPLLLLLAMVFSVLGGYVAAVVVFHQTSAAFLATFSSNFTLPDLFGALIKTTIFGLIIAVVCCHQGLNASGGPEGVGRAVNVSVVICFLAVWAVNDTFNSLLLGAFPETTNLH